MRFAISLLLLWAACSADAPPQQQATPSPPAATVTPPAPTRPPPPAAAPAPEREPQRPEIVLPPLDPAQKTDYDDNGLRRIGAHRDLPAPPKTGWTKDEDGAAIWRIEIRSPGAAALRLHFTELRAEAGHITVQEADRSLRPATVRRLEGRGPAGDGELWSDIIDGEAAIVEYRPANGDAGGALPFRIDKISHLWQSPLDAF